MDILISSNLERFLFEITNHDWEKITQWMKELQEKGEFSVDKATFESISEILESGFAGEKETLATIKKTFEETGYTLDTHTAVAVKVYEDYKQATGDKTKTIIDATASPFKFNASVLEAIKGPEAVENKDEFQILEELSKVSGQEIHPGLKDLDMKPVLHEKVCGKEEIKDIIKRILKL